METVMENEILVFEACGIRTCIPKNLLLKDAARMVDVSPAYLRVAIRRGELQMISRKRIAGPGSEVRVAYDELVKWANEDSGDNSA
jgi:hypothetical protein